ncbi:MAG: aspartate aminotransferase family protein [Solirubrobacterales bacterium]|nr:aspartate aminotransferase family protein [Solirubrobacterales bacterium]
MGAAAGGERYTGPLAPASKRELLDRAGEFWNPAKVAAWRERGVDLAIGRREGYLLWDIDGRRLIDVHLNGGTFNLGHRNPELVAALVEGAQTFDVGNHHFPSLARTALAERLVATAGAGMDKAVFGASGGEAIDIAIKSARRATGRRTIVTIENGFHGHTGLAMCASGPKAAAFLVDRPGEFATVPFNDAAAVERRLADGDVAAVLVETIPATAGFPLPEPGYLAAVKRACERHGALYVADEVQTGLMRTGSLWAIHRHGVQPDVIVTAKGLGGGLYPLSAAILGEAASGWLDEDGWGHVSTTAGSELGCVVALAVLDITLRPSVGELVEANARRLAAGFAELRERYGDYFSGVRQEGLVIGLEFAPAEGAKHAMRALYENGVWAIFSSFDPRVLQFKPGLLVEPELCEEILQRLGDGLAVARERALAAEAGG